MSWFVSVESLAAGVVFETRHYWVPGYPTPQTVVVPATTARVYVRPRGSTTTTVAVYPNPDGSGAPLVQPLAPDEFGRLPGYVAQPAPLDMVYSDVTAPGIPTRTVAVGQERDIALIADPHVVGSQVAMLSIPGAHEGTVAVRSDLDGESFILGAGDPTVIGSWVAIGLVDAVPTAQKGVAGGVGTLDGTTHQPLSEAPVTVQTVADAFAPVGTALDRTQPVFDAALGTVIFREPTYLAQNFGVIADGAQHNNVANLLDCLATAAAHGVKRVEFPGGVIDTSEAVVNAVLAADSGRTYTNNAGLPLPPGVTGLSIEGQGLGVTTLKLSGGLPRAFDFFYAGDGQVYKQIAIRRMTIDANNVSGTSVGPVTAVTAGATLVHGSAWTTLPGISSVAFKNARAIYFLPTNAGTAEGFALAARVNAGNVQVRNDSGSTDYTLITGDQVQGAMRDHVIAGTWMAGGSVPRGWNMQIDHFTVEDVESINVPTMTAASLVTPKADSRPNVDVGVSKNGGWGGIPSVTNCHVRRTYMHGGEAGASCEGSAGCFVDLIKFEDCFHDTGVNVPSNYSSLNFLIGSQASVGRVDVIRCHGRRSGDVTLELDQPWEAHCIDNKWEEGFSGVYRTTYAPPARTSAGAPTTTTNNGVTLTAIAGTTSITGLPATVAQQGFAMIDSELIWYQASTAGTTLAIWRSLNGSTATTHVDGSKITFIEVEKTRIWDVRTTIRNQTLMSITNAGRSYLAFTNSFYPLPPITIRDPTIETIGGDLMNAQHIYWSGWQTDFDIQGLRLNQNALAHPASDSTRGSGISWDWPAGQVSINPTVWPTPRVYGRNNVASVHGTMGTTNGYILFRPGTGSALVDFDLNGEVVLAGASVASVAVAQIGPPSGRLTLAPCSRLGLKFRFPNGVTSDIAPAGIVVSSGTSVGIAYLLDLDIDAYEFSFSTSSTDANYRPWVIDPTQATFVRFGKVVHSVRAALAYPVKRKQVVQVATFNTPYTVQGFEDEIHVNTALGACQINLPNSSGGASGQGSALLGLGRRITIVDIGFAASTFNITIQPVSTDLLDGGAAGVAQVINTVGGHKTYVSEPARPGWISV